MTIAAIYKFIWKPVSDIGNQIFYCNKVLLQHKSFSKIIYLDHCVQNKAINTKLIKKQNFFKKITRRTKAMMQQISNLAWQYEIEIMDF